MNISVSKCTAIATLCLIGLSGTASAAMDPQLENTLIQVCKAGASNKITTFNNTMRDFRINKQVVFPRLVCNGENFYQFAFNQGAYKTANKINQYVQGQVYIKDLVQTNLSKEVYAVNY